MQLNEQQNPNSNLVSAMGLNLQAIFNIEDLPQGILKNNNDNYTQLFLYAHGGKKMWQALKQTDINSENPVDDFSMQLVTNYFRSEYPNNKFTIMYPGVETIGLRALGELAGWHHDSPFRIGINKDWGSWFAYRAVVLADTNLETSKKVESESPCHGCIENLCISACPANAMKDGILSLDSCIQYRKQANSQCKKTCLSRIACPVAPQHRYTEEQINYHYSVSMKTIDEFY